MSRWQLHEMVVRKARRGNTYRPVNGVAVRVLNLEGVPVDLYADPEKADRLPDPMFTDRDGYVTAWVDEDVVKVVASDPWNTGSAVVHRPLDGR
jgi:hypothetical protein